MTHDEAVIIDGVRTPIGRAGEKGWMKEIRADDMAVAVVKALLERTGIDPKDVDDVYFGVANQSGEQGVNLARNVVLLSGMPVEVPGTTVDRQCGSSLQAINFAAMSVMAGNADVIVCGGVESMSRVPMGAGWNPNPELFKRIDPSSVLMGQTAENLADKYEITRERMDEFALESHQKAVAARDSGRFEDEIVPIKTPSGEEIEKDQCPRADTSLEKLASLAPVFRPDGGRVTAGNSSPINDGAAAVLVMSAKKSKEMGIEPMAHIRAFAAAGVQPEIMGIGPVPATRKALAQLDAKIEDLDLIEMNEAFAVQNLCCVRDLDLDMEKLNVNGGAIALGHPLGASGARLMTTLLHEMKRRDAGLGLATLCIGFGQGIATIVERNGL